MESFYTRAVGLPQRVVSRGFWDFSCIFQWPLEARRLAQLPGRSMVMLWSQTALNLG